MFTKKIVNSISLGLAVILIGVGISSQKVNAKTNKAYEIFTTNGANGLITIKGTNVTQVYLNKSHGKYYMSSLKAKLNKKTNKLTATSKLIKVRVTKATYKNNNYYFYSKTTSKVIPSKKIHKTGNYKYRLTVKDAKKIAAVPVYKPGTKDLAGKIFYKMYVINKQTYLNPYKTEAINNN